MRIVILAIALAGLAVGITVTSIRTSASWVIKKEVISSGGGLTSTESGKECFSSFGQPQIGQVHGTNTVNLGFLSNTDTPSRKPPKPPGPKEKELVF